MCVVSLSFSLARSHLPYFVIRFHFVFIHIRLFHTLRFASFFGVNVISRVAAAAGAAAAALPRQSSQLFAFVLLPLLFFFFFFLCMSRIFAASRLLRLCGDRYHDVISYCAHKRDIHFLHVCVSVCVRYVTLRYVSVCATLLPMHFLNGVRCACLSTGPSVRPVSLSLFSLFLSLSLPMLVCVFIYCLDQNTFFL